MNPHSARASLGGNGVDAGLVERLRAQVADRLDARVRADEATGRPRMGLADQRQLGRQLIGDALEAEARAALAAGRPTLELTVEDAVGQAVHDALFGLGRLERLLDDPEIENINANGCDRVFVRYADGRRAQVDPIATSDTELVELIRLAAARLGLGERRFDLGAPRLSVQLPDGSRLFAVMAVAARPSLSIRRHRYQRVDLRDLARVGTLDDALRGFLAAAVRARKNLIVCGDTGAGKTTLLRALAAEIPPAERLVTVEDALELGLDRFPDVHPDVVALEAREPNVEGEGTVTQAELVRWALRMSPDRVLVGEVRGEEVLPMLNAMSQGNDGSMCTLHASSSAGAFAKLATYAIQAPERLPLEATNLLVATAVHFIVFLAHDRASGRRVITSVREVTGADGPVVSSNEVFRPGPGRRAVPGAPLRVETLDQLLDAGLDPELLDVTEERWDAPLATGSGYLAAPDAGWAR
jgi:Flp pilus assembly CpaF family ATPase